MVRRAIEIDEDTDRLLGELASQYDGDLSLAVSELVQAYKGIEGLADRSEEAVEDALHVLRDKAEADFREGRTLTWEQVKARNGL
jgi:hypothetical protein